MYFEEAVVNVAATRTNFGFTVHFLSLLTRPRRTKLLAQLYFIYLEHPNLQLLSYSLLVDDLAEHVTLEAIVVKLYESFGPCHVGKPVEELIVVALSRRSLQHGVEVLLGQLSLDALVEGADFHINEFLACQQGPGELVIEAPAHEDDLDEHDVEHVCPAH